MITLKTLGTATAQEVFDQVILHLRKQGEKCVTLEGDCAYRSGNLKCAAGCLIGKDEYEENMEGKNWYTVVKSYNITNRHIPLIEHLQTIHDDNVVEDWEGLLEELSESYDLIYTKP